MEHRGGGSQQDWFGNEAKKRHAMSTCAKNTKTEQTGWTLASWCFHTHRMAISIRTAAKGMNNAKKRNSLTKNRSLLSSCRGRHAE